MVKLRVDDLAWQRRMRLVDLARESGLHPATVSEYWHNRVKSINIETATKIAAALGVRFCDLIDDRDTIPEQQREKQAA